MNTMVRKSFAIVLAICILLPSFIATAIAADVTDVSRISSVYDNLESYSLSTGAITQCNITLLNDEQECIAYMIGDFQYGNCIAWISPDYENAFVAQEGPQPDN